MINLLRLLQLSDSAIPIGGTAHSFGLEMLAALGYVETDSLESFLRDYLKETGLLDAVYCRAAWGSTLAELSAWNDELSALRTSAELRNASLVLGRRFLRLCSACEAREEFSRKLNLHHSLAFGYVCGVLEIDRELTVRAFLHQSVANLTSAALRLLPVGQVQASRILWRLKPSIDGVAQRSASLTTQEATAFTPLLDIASMRHRRLETRLFIS